MRGRVVFWACGWWMNRCVVHVVNADRFIWVAYKPNGTNKIRIASHNFPKDGLVEFEIGSVRAKIWD